MLWNCSLASNAESTPYPIKKLHTLVNQTAMDVFQHKERTRRHPSNSQMLIKGRKKRLDNWEEMKLNRKRVDIVKEYR